MKLKEFKFNNLVLNKTAKLKGLQTEYYEKTGKYPIVDQGQAIIAGYTDNENAVLRLFDNPVIVFGDHTRIFKYVDFDFAIGADGVKVLFPNTDIIDPQFLYMILSHANFPNDGYSRHYKYLKKLSFKIPERIEDQILIAKELQAKLDHVDIMRQAVSSQLSAINWLPAAILREAFDQKNKE